ncbi:MAG: isoprenoid biosynthesis glyoxalase ElbB [Phycisphaerales bacterium]|nr:isoprenoid biosynthesis glyoxalase ElbB [Phycisphaerales bacterium]
MATNVLMILSGCGVLDGSEIHESVSTLVHLDRNNATVTFAAPDIDQFHVINHQTGQPSKEQRNVRAESARIARGPVKDLADVHGDQFDAVILPGGFGAAKNLCNFASAGAECQVNPDVARVLTEAHEAGKPIGLICISPTIGAKVFRGATVTIGIDTDTAAAIQEMGSRHQNRAANEICVDEGHRIVSTPAYMSAERISQAFDGIGKLVDRVVQMARQHKSAPQTAGTLR